MLARIVAMLIKMLMRFDPEQYRAQERLVCSAHKPWKNENWLFCQILTPLQTEPLPDRLYSAKIPRALWLVGFSG
jgi:hypothetical protein